MCLCAPVLKYLGIKVKNGSTTAKTFPVAESLPKQVHRYMHKHWDNLARPVRNAWTLVCLLLNVKERFSRDFN